MAGHARRNRIVALALVGLFLLACGDSMSGKYEDDSGVLSVEFKSGKAYVTMIGTTTETDYEVNGDKDVFKNSPNSGNTVMTIQKDGSLSGPMGVTLKKKK
jgi:hypothetical protein